MRDDGRGDDRGDPRAVRRRVDEESPDHDLTPAMPGRRPGADNQLDATGTDDEVAAGISEDSQPRSTNQLTT